MKKLFYLLVLLIGCEQAPMVELKEDPSLNEMERLVARDWQYQDLIVDNDTFNFIAGNFEPNLLVGVWGHVQYRWFSYDPDKTYEFNGDRFTPSIGSINSVNFQPNLGYWSISTNGDTLRHNEYEYYFTIYRVIELSDELFIREYERVVYASGDTIRYPVGDTITYKEILIPK